MKNFRFCFHLVLVGGHISIIENSLFSTVQMGRIVLPTNPVRFREPEDGGSNEINGAGLGLM